MISRQEYDLLVHYILLVVAIVDGPQDLVHQDGSLPKDVRSGRFGRALAGGRAGERGITTPNPPEGSVIPPPAEPIILKILAILCFKIREKQANSIQLLNQVIRLEWTC